MALKDNILKFSKRQIDDAGNVLIDSNSSIQEKEHALEILGNFRSCHAYPINTFQSTLRQKLNRTGVDYLVSQRLKRTPSMLLKLERFPNMRLSQMQDIGGLRAILPSMTEVNQIVDLYKNMQFQHYVKNEKDYILNPKDSGYRCYHIVYKYKNLLNKNYDGLMIELQIRTRLQHAWATAVETMGTFIDHSLKSSQGPQDYLDFFALVGNAFAYIENTSTLSRFDNFSKNEIFNKVKVEANRLQIVTQLEGFSQVISNIETDKKQGSLHLVVLDISNKEVRIRTFPKISIEQASAEYLKEEALIADGNKRQVVLVSSNSLDSLRKAYPSYFLDTQEFIETLKEILES
ncbi:(p)ppGpp synthetase [Chryseobacterium sp. CBo1]|uniref:RelA/SpoT domain-containing protein n=1 Tax=Chryseobacterium sp. CBo1 TaxID=1869230 RepID=UPI0008105565|nr:RelA/SpoT domain-containing protein [Chryseobacterium sp. CBo1]OCK51348.1 (p)ppGpp synthetase [Chryseobacterium sp. CBo1]